MKKKQKNGSKIEIRPEKTLNESELKDKVHREPFMDFIDKEYYF